MRVVAAVVALAVVLALCAGARADDDKVVVLSPDNFDDEIAKNDLTLVEFYAPWCGHCKALAPEFADAAEKLEGQNAGVLAKVDCDQDSNRELCGKFDVRGFPTVKLFRNDGSDPIDYDQARKADAIVRYMKKQGQPAVTELADAAAAKAFAAEDSVQVIAFVGADDDVSGFETVAKALRNEYSFGVVRDNADAAGEFGVTAPGVVVRRDFDDGDVVYTGDFASADLSDELTSFIKAQSFPLVGLIGPENYQKYLERGFNFVWLFIDLDSDAETALIADVVTPVAKEFRDQLSFVKLDGKKWGEHAKSFGLSGSTPGVVVEDREKRVNFVFNEDDELTLESFKKFVTGYTDGSLEPTIKSADEPEDNTKPVTVLVGNTFKTVAFDATKDVLVEFYAPWCGHCKKLAPTYDEVGEVFANNPNIVVASLDATANDTPGEEIRGFPTLKFYPAGEGAETIDYEGARTKEAIVAFINENKKSAEPAADAAESDDSEEAAGHDEL